MRCSQSTRTRPRASCRRRQSLARRDRDLARDQVAQLQPAPRLAPHRTLPAAWRAEPPIAPSRLKVGGQATSRAPSRSNAHARAPSRTLAPATSAGKPPPHRQGKLVGTIWGVASAPIPDAREARPSGLPPRARAKDRAHYGGAGPRHSLAPCGAAKAVAERAEVVARPTRPRCGACPYKPRSFRTFTRRDFVATR